MSEHRNPWAILGIAPGSDERQVKRAYRTAARQWHPDHNRDDPSAEARFRDIAWAYEELSDPARRASYNGAPAGASTRAGSRAAEAEHWEEVFAQASPRAPRRGKDIELSVDVSFLQAYTGTEIEARTTGSETCQSCAGSGVAPGAMVRDCHVCHGLGIHQAGRVATTCAACSGSGRTIERACPDCHEGRVLRRRTQRVGIPAGVSDGQRLVVDGAGEDGAEEPGDLLVTVNIQPSRTFQRLEGADLLIDVPVTYAEACLGAEVQVPTPEKSILMRIPPGSGTGALLRVRGRGMPVLGAEDERGDLYARVTVAVPTRLSNAQRRLIAQLAAHDDKELREELLSNAERL